MRASRCAWNGICKTSFRWCRDLTCHHHGTSEHAEQIDGNLIRRPLQSLPTTCSTSFATDSRL
jgi:hypothetical protein